ncbi:MAG: hypothetical protein DWQ36_17765 [Acidobacteria bacterium]|nr:MAG: hypothetical protein DWQ30_15785 [Acidobacteriota bacterium]REK04288.1 MAG: hypothetical protein DWQ36_17765 [Acidobacteriota bacterium]
MRRNAASPGDPPPRWPTLALLTAAAASVGALSWWIAAGAGPALAAGSAGAVVAAAADTSGAGLCADCHDDMVASLAGRPHSVLLDGSSHWGDGGEEGCVACHAGGVEHAESGGEAPVYAFSTDSTAQQRSRTCQSCHGAAHPRFDRSEHAKAGLDCTSCHSTHGEIETAPLLAADLVGRPSATCAGCHAGSFSDFRAVNAHPIEQGTMECTACHDPHAPATRVALGGFKQQACADCHVDKAGPFVFEHGSSIVEGCTSCHEPHGGPNRHQLTFQSTAELCTSCHLALPGFHARFNETTQCTNCHVTIHGSNLHPGFLQ